MRAGADNLGRSHWFGLVHSGRRTVISSTTSVPAGSEDEDAAVCCHDCDEASPRVTACGTASAGKARLSGKVGAGGSVEPEPEQDHDEDDPCDHHERQHGHEVPQKPQPPDFGVILMCLSFQLTSPGPQYGTGHISSF